MLSCECPVDLFASSFELAIQLQKNRHIDYVPYNRKTEDTAALISESSLGLQTSSLYCWQKQRPDADAK